MAANNDRMTTTLETVTPDKARAYLETSEGNRPIDKGHVRSIADDIEHDRWRLTHQGIAFDRTGHLKDGQHRLHAIIAAGKSVPIQVTRNLTEDAMAVIDQHRRRTAAQILAMKGIRTDAPRLTAMARAILAVVHNQTRVSNDAASDYAATHVDTFKRYLRIARDYTPAVAAAFAWADMQGWDEVQSAAQRLTEAMWSGTDDPMRALWTRSKAFRKEGAGQPAIKRKFDIALSCLLAVHEGRGMVQARSVQPDYAAIAQESQRPNA